MGHHLCTTKYPNHCALYMSVPFVHIKNVWYYYLTDIILNYYWSIILNTYNYQWATKFHQFIILTLERERIPYGERNSSSENTCSSKALTRSQGRSDRKTSSSFRRVTWKTIQNRCDFPKRTLPFFTVAEYVMTCYLHYAKSTKFTNGEPEYSTLKKKVQSEAIYQHRNNVTLTRMKLQLQYIKNLSCQIKPQNGWNRP